MNLSRRLERLERHELLTGPSSVIDRFAVALDETARRLTGKTVQAVGSDQAILNLIADTVGEEFFPRLNGAELAILIAELERIGFGSDIAARDAARQAY
jgi:hypothetical protein